VLSIDASATLQYLLVVIAACAAALAGTGWAACTAQPTGRRRLLWIVAIVAGAEAAYGIVQWVSESPHVLWLEKSAYLDSATGTLINRNHFAALLYLGVGAALSLMIGATADRRDRSQRDRTSDLTLLALLGLLFAGLVASKSRAGLALSLLVLAAGATTPWRRLSGRTRIVAAVLALLVTVPIALLAAPDLLRRISELPNEWQHPESRVAALRVAWSTFSQFPVIGTGAGTFDLAFTHFRPAEMQARYNEAHNDYAQTLAESGLIGLILACLPLALITRWVWLDRASRATRELVPLWCALLAVAAHEFVDFPLRIPALVMLVAFIVGAVLPVPPGSGRLRRWIALPLLATSAVSALYLLAFFELRLFGSWPRIAESEYRAVIDRARAFDQGHGKDDLCAGLQLSAALQQLRPLSGVYAIRHSRLLLSGVANGAFPSGEHEQRYQQAADAAARARRTDPWNTNLVRRPLVQIELELGDIEQALEDAGQVARLNDEIAPSVAEDLYRSGIPPQLVFERMSSSRSASDRLLAILIESEDRAGAAAVVALDLPSEPQWCGLSAPVSQILREVHGTSPERFLRGCLELQNLDAPTRLQLRLGLIWELIHQQRWDEARERVLTIEQPVERTRMEMEIAQRRRDWPTVRSALLRLLRLPRGKSQESESYLRMTLGDALAHTGDIPGAIEEYQRAARIDPLAAETSARRIANLRLGILPE
jgi:O-antigen ligase